MKKFNSFTQNEQLDILLDFSMGKVRMFVWVDSGKFTHFIPQEDPSFVRSAEAGKYEIISAEVVDRLDEAVIEDSKIFRIGGNYWGEFSDSVLSPDGTTGWIGLRDPTRIGGDYEPLIMPTSKILVDFSPVEGSEPHQLEPGSFPPTPEFLKVIELWQEFGKKGKFDVKKEVVITILESEGFSTPSAKAIDRICRGSMERGGRKSSD